MTGQTMEYVDAHCHVDLYDSPEDILRSIEANRIHTIAVTNAPFVFSFTQKLAAGSRYLHPALGMHPELIATHHHRLEEIWPLFSLTRFIGEIGLDYVTRDETLRERQRATLRRILDECAERRDKVITLHTRRSAMDVIEMIGPAFPGTIILHWFSGSKSELRKAIEYGFYFSLNRPMFFSKTGPALIEVMPRERVLTETDGPYTNAEYGQARPVNVIETCKLLASEWKVSEETAAQMVRENFRSATGIA